MLNKLSATDAVEAPEAGQTFGPPPAQGFDLHEALSFVWRQWKFIAAFVGIALLIGVIVDLKQTPRYTATALVLLEPQKQPIPGDEQSAAGLNDTIVENEVAVIRSTAFLRHVVERTHLVSDPEFGSTVPQESKEVKVPSPAGEPIPPNVLASVGALQGAMTVERMGLGTIFAISITSVDPTRAAMLANAVASGYVVEKLDARFDAAKNASAWLSDRLVDLRAQLRQSEEAVAQFRSDHGLVQSGSNVSLNQQQLSDLNVKLVEARNDLAQKKARVDLLRSIKEKGGNIQSLPNLPDSGCAASASYARCRSFTKGSRPCGALQRTPSARRQHPGRTP